MLNIKLVNTDGHCHITSNLIICCITNVEVYNWRRSNVNCESVCTNRVDWEVDVRMRGQLFLDMSC